jgi:hypothetical protein
MKSLAIAFGLFAAVNSFAGVIYSNSADLSTGTRFFKLDSAEYKLIPTKTEIRQIPGCIPHGDRHPTECQTEIVLESQPVIRVNVSYDDPFVRSEGQEKSWIGFNLRLEEISGEDLAALKSVYPTWRHPFSRVGQRIAKKNFILEVKKSERTIQVVDVRNSRLCPVMDNGLPFPGCVERIVYKPAKTWVTEVSVLKK